MTPRVCVGWWWQQWQSHLQVLGTGLSLLAGLCVHVRTEISPCELDGSKCRLRQQSCRGCPPPRPASPMPWSLQTTISCFPFALPGKKEGSHQHHFPFPNKETAAQGEEGSYQGWNREPESGPGTLTASSWLSGWGTGLSHSAGSLFLKDTGSGAGEHVCDKVPSVPQSLWSPQASPGRP